MLTLSKSVDLSSAFKPIGRNNIQVRFPKLERNGMKWYGPCSEVNVPVRRCQKATPKVQRQNQIGTQRSQTRRPLTIASWSPAQPPRRLLSCFPTTPFDWPICERFHPARSFSVLVSPGGNNENVLSAATTVPYLLLGWWTQHSRKEKCSSY